MPLWEYVGKQVPNSHVRNGDAARVPCDQHGVRETTEAKVQLAAISRLRAETRSEKLPAALTTEMNPVQPHAVADRLPTLASRPSACDECDADSIAT